MLEVDFELVALDRRDRAIAELAVEHALTEREVVTALVAEADGRRARFNDALRLGIVGGVAGTLPAGAARGASNVGEGIRALRPLCAPQALAAGHGRFFFDVRLGELGDEARRDRAGPLAVDAAVIGAEKFAHPPRLGCRAARGVSF